MAARILQHPVSVGSKFTRWTVVSEADPKFYEGPKGIVNHPYWNCICECGTERQVRQTVLRSGKSRSCGCLHDEELGSRKLKHGYAAGGVIRPEYYVWQAMVARCVNPKIRMYPHYGGRGITVCERWLKFENFLEDMGNRPSDDHSLDRIENDKGYEYGNCRWAVPEVQQNNRRNTVFVEYNGERLPLAEVVRKHNSVVDLEVVRCRVMRQGWSLERAMSTPKLR
jgi:hypothetical protein